MIHGVLAGTDSGQSAVNDFDTSVADRVLDVVRDSFVSGVQFSLRVVAAIAFIGLIIAGLGVRPRAAAETPATAPAEA